MFCFKIVLLMGALFRALAFSQYLGNPAAACFPWSGLFTQDEENLALKVGYQKDRVFRKKLKDTDLSIQRNANQAVFSLNFFDRAELFSAIGKESFALSGAALEKNQGLDWMIGTRATLFRFPDLYFSLTGGFLTAYLNQLSSLRSYQEWQLELSVCKKIEFFTLYLSGAYSQGELRCSKSSLMTTHPFLLIVGGSFFTRNGFSINGELRFFGELGLGFDFNFRL